MINISEFNLFIIVSFGTLLLFYTIMEIYANITKNSIEFIYKQNINIILLWISSFILIFYLIGQFNLIYALSISYTFLFSIITTAILIKSFKFIFKKVKNGMIKNEY